MVKKLTIKKQIISISLLGLLFLFSCLSSTDSTIFSFNCVNVSNKLIAGYTTHDPIFIDSSDDFSTYGFPGTGDPGTPYLIANYSITAGADYSIKITNVNDYFIIENCYTESSLHGIDVLSVGTGRATVRNNTCIDHTFGIYLEYAAQSQILNNTVTDTKWAIFVDFSGGSVIQDNTCTKAFMGIHSMAGGQINISNNSLIDNLVGLFVYHIELATITDNKLTNTGLCLHFNSVDDYSTLTLTGNTINGLPIAVIYNQADQTIDASLYGQIIVIESERITITDLSVSPVTIYGIHLYYCNSCIVTDTVIKNNFYGIFAYYSPDTEISSNTCSNEYFALDDLNKQGSAIQLRYSNNSIVKDNICEDYGDGISSFRSFNIDVLRNTCDYNDIGISLYAQDCLIEDNHINNNVEGIAASGSGSLNATGIEIISNTITGSLAYGIRMYSYSLSNVIHHNILIDNFLGGTSQAYDVGVGNVWYDTSTNQGNYWSDWSGSGAYSIDGSAGSEDPYPLSSISEFSIKTAILFAILVSCIAIIPLIKKRKS